MEIIAVKNFKLFDYQMNYFNSSPSRMKAFNEFNDLAQEILDGKLKHYNSNNDIIKIFNIIEYTDEHGYPFNLDLHGFRRNEAINVINKFLHLIEKHKVPAYYVIHGKSGDSMFDAAVECLSK